MMGHHYYYVIDSEVLSSSHPEEFSYCYCAGDLATLFSQLLNKKMPIHQLHLAQF